MDTESKKGSGRKLASDELEACKILGLSIGVDIDDEVRAPIQLYHIVSSPTHDTAHPICGIDTLWGYGFSLEDGLISCEKCLAKLPVLIDRANRRISRV